MSDKDVNNNLTPKQSEPVQSELARLLEPLKQQLVRIETRQAKMMIHFGVCPQRESKTTFQPKE